MKVLEHTSLDFISLLNEDINNLDLVLDYFESVMKGFDVNLEVKGKNINVANAEQAGWFSYYDSIRVELKHIVEFVSMKLDCEVSNLYVRFNEKHNRSLGPTQIKEYIKREPTYLALYMKYLQSVETYDKCKSIVDSFTARGYTLKNMSGLLIAGIDDFIIE